MNNILEIIIPAYNCSKTLNRTLDSLIYQTNKNFKVLIIDDCSTEDIKSIINTYFGKLNITYIRNEKNIGCGMSRQRGIDETTADYITFLDSDDILLPNAVEDWLKVINQQQPDVIYSPFCEFYKNRFRIKNNGFFMTHGKVYNVDFLRKYDIRESEQVKCNDDIYLNWQVFDLASDIYLLRTLTNVYIIREDSVSNSKGFTFWATVEFKKVENLAKQQISRFKNIPLLQYREIGKQVDYLLFEDRENHEKQIEEIKKYKEENKWQK